MTSNNTIVFKAYTSLKLHKFGALHSSVVIAIAIANTRRDMHSVMPKAKQQKKSNPFVLDCTYKKIALSTIAQHNSILVELCGKKGNESSMQKNAVAILFLCRRN